MKVYFSLIVLCWGISAARAETNPPLIRLLIVDGQNNHDWQATTPYLRKILEASGRFVVEVATAPPSPSTPGGKERYALSPDQYAKDLQAFRPEFDRFDVILLNYNGESWSEETHAALESAIANGKGLVVIHAANNAFFNRKQYDRMLGLAWRPKDYGVRLEINESGQVNRIPSGAGPDMGHGKRHAFQVTVRDAAHPITSGMPAKWMHEKDELYHGLRGPAEELTLLATAFSDPSQGGTGVHEPIAWTVKFEKGRVFHTTLGHDVSSMQCVGFITLLLRGSEWAATGQVTSAVPEDFPTENAVRTRGGWWIMLDRVKSFWPFIFMILLVGFIGWRWRRQRKKTVPKLS